MRRGSIQQADAKVQEVQSKMELARTRVRQNRELVATGAGDKFALERAETDVQELGAVFGKVIELSGFSRTIVNAAIRVVGPQRAMQRRLSLRADRQ